MVFEECNEGILLRVRLTPNASFCGVKGTFTDSDGREFLRLQVVSVPEKGKANKELIAYLAKTLHFPKTAFDIIGGELDRYKRIVIAGGDDVKERLREWLTKEGVAL